MKWYAGYIAEIITFIGYIIYEAQFIDNQDLGTLNFSSFIIAAIIAGFIGGFLSPYHIKKVSKYAASTFTVIAGVPVLILFAVSGSILSGDDADFGAVIILIFVLVAGIALVILIIVVSALLIGGGYIGSVFGKMVFKEEVFDDQPQYEETHYPPQNEPIPYQQAQENVVTCYDCNTTQERRNFCVNCGSELQLK